MGEASLDPKSNIALTLALTPFKFKVYKKKEIKNLKKMKNRSRGSDEMGEAPKSDERG
jgi:hypothetical protein